MASMRAAVLAVVAILLAGACSDDPDRDSSGDTQAKPTTKPTTKPATSSATSPSDVLPATRIVVLGDSNASPTSCYRCSTFPQQVAAALGEAQGSRAEVVDLAWELSNPKPAEMVDIVRFVRSSDAARDALAGADAVLILGAQNDLAYNRRDDPCGVAPAYPRVRWQGLTHDCMDAVLRDYEGHLEALLDEIDALRTGEPTMLRIVTAYNSVIGDLVDPTWNSPAALEPSTYHVSRMVAIQCRLAARHSGQCADAFHALNGPDGGQSAQPFLNSVDAAHLAQRGHDEVAALLVDLGFAPLRG